MAASKKWEETGVFSLSDEKVPKIGESDDLMSAALTLSSSKPVASQLFDVGGTLYAVKLKKQEEAKDVDMKKIKADVTKTLSQNVFSNWSSGLFEKAKIKTNPRLVSDDQSDN